MEEMTLQEMLNKVDITQAEMAKSLGLSESHVSLLISGKRRMSVDYAAQIAKCLDTTIDVIFHAINFAKSKEGHKLNTSSNNNFSELELKQRESTSKTPAVAG